MNKRLILETLLALTLIAAFLGAFNGAFAVDKPFRVGVTAGPHAQIVEVAKKVAAKDGLDVQIVESTDFIQPNAALAQEQLDANVYQHLPFLETQNRDRGYKLVSVAPAVRQQMGIYSKIKDSLALENPNTPYVTVVIATRDGQQNDPALRKFVKAYQLPEVKQFIDAQFKGAYRAAW